MIASGDLKFNDLNSVLPNLFLVRFIEVSEPNESKGGCLRMDDLEEDLYRKKELSKKSRAVRLMRSVFDPRAYLHILKIINYYNYSHVEPLRKMKVGADPAISPNASFSNPERIEIGERCRIGARCTLWAGPGTGKIIIGDDVLFAPEVMITAANYRYNDGSPVTKQAMDEADVVVGDDVWLGARAILLPGARVGRGSIIGAGALVRGEVPEFSIAVGAPARVVGQRKVESLNE